MVLELDSLEKAVVSLEAILDRAHDERLMAMLDEVTQGGLKYGAIQHF